MLADLRQRLDQATSQTMTLLRGATILLLVSVAALSLVLWGLPGDDPAPLAKPLPSPPAAAPAKPGQLEDAAVLAMAAATRPGAIFSSGCALCHGAAGHGNAELRAPSIAGQPAWYLRTQLRRFRSGKRGAHPEDTTGQQMAVVARALAEESIDALVLSIHRMTPQPMQASLGGDAKRGKMIYFEQCMECHRYNGHGEMAFRSCPLTAFPDWYLADQFEKFRRGVRGHLTDDVEGGKMREVVKYVDADDCRDVLAHLAVLAAKYPMGK